MERKRLSVILFLLSLLITSGRVASAVPPFTSVPEAIALITRLLEARGLELAATVDHAANAATVNLTLPQTTVLFFRGSRRAERALVARLPTVGLDLPGKVLVWEDAEGVVRFKVNRQGYLGDRHGVGVRSMLLARLGSLLEYQGDDDGLIFTESQHGVNRTVERLKDAIRSREFRIVLEFNLGGHRGQARLIIFGNPAVGTRLMQNRQEIGIDLPQKFLVYSERRREKVFIAHNDPKFIAQRAGVRGLDMLLDNVARVLQSLANEASVSVMK